MKNKTPQKKTLTSLIIAILILFTFLESKAQELTLGVALRPVNISELYSFGIGMSVNKDYSNEGKGFDLTMNILYLLPDDSFEFINSNGAFQADLFTTYNFVVANGVRLGPSIGGGAISEFFEDFDTEDTYYIMYGASISVNIGDRLSLGLDINNAIVDNGDLMITPTLRFNL